MIYDKCVKNLNRKKHASGTNDEPYSPATKPSNRKRNPDPLTNRYTGTLLPVIIEYFNLIRVFDGHEIRFVVTPLGEEFVCIIDVKNSTHYSLHDAAEKNDIMFLTKEGKGGKKLLRFIKTSELSNTDVFKAPPEAFKRLVKWQKQKFKGNHPVPTIDPFRSQPDSIVVVDNNTFIKKVALLLLAFKRGEISYTDYICYMEVECDHIIKQNRKKENTK